MAAQKRIDNLSGTNQTPSVFGGRAVRDMIFVFGGKNDAESGM